MSHALRRSPARRTAPGVYTVRLVTVLLFLLVAIPSRLIFLPLGGAGTPAGVFGVCLFVYWLFRRVSDQSTRQRRRTAVHIGILTFAFSVLASYLVAATRPITGVELSGADRGLLLLIGWLGMALTVADAPRTLDELKVILRRASLAGGLLATLGIVQFLTKLALTNYIVIPGLTLNSDLSSVIARNGLARPAGTAIHPIEFGAVLTMLLPIALHFAMHDRHRHFLARWYPVVAIAIAVPISVSRSAIVSATVVLLVLVPSWSKKVRRRAYAAMVVLIGVLYVFVHGLIGTITSLFTGISNDDSAASRSESYGLAFAMIKRHLLFGRGFNTFTADYRILDNSYLGLLVVTGVFGLLATFVLLGSGIVAAVQGRRISTSPETRSLGLSLAAAVLSTTCSIALYDSFGFPMATGLLFVALGACGALRRLSGEAPANAASPVRAYVSA